MWRIPESELGVLGDVARPRRARVRLRRRALVGRARRATAPGSSRSTSRRASCATPRALVDATSVAVPLVCASGEAVPLADASFDLVFCDHGAMSFCDPDRSVPEVARLLRRGGRLVFSHTTPWPYLAWNFERDRVTRRLRRPYFGMRRFADGGRRAPSTSSCRTASGSGASGATASWSTTWSSSGRPKHARTTFDDFDARWARRWPAEQVWVVRKE